MAVSYQMKECRRVGKPKLKAGTTDTYVQRMSVETSIVDDTHGFMKRDLASFEFLNTDTHDQIEAKCSAAAAAYVTATYPDVA